MAYYYVYFLTFVACFLSPVRQYAMKMFHALFCLIVFPFTDGLAHKHVNEGATTVANFNEAFTRFAEITVGEIVSEGEQRRCTERKSASAMESFFKSHHFNTEGVHCSARTPENIVFPAEREAMCNPVTTGCTTASPTIPQTTQTHSTDARKPVVITLVYCDPAGF